jgi:hypothetical protein
MVGALVLLPALAYFLLPQRRLMTDTPPVPALEPQSRARHKKMARHLEVRHEG